MNEQRKRRGILSYLILANALTWLCWIPAVVLANRQGYLLPTADNFVTLVRSGFVDTQHVLVALIFQLGVYGPLVAAIVGLAVEGDQDAADLWWRRLVRWRVSLRWYLIALAIALLLPLIPAVGGALIGLSAFSFVPVGYVLALLLVQLLTSGLGEEPGWRGYLLPRLQQRFGGGGATWRLGLIWALWHYPITIVYALAPLNETTPMMAAIVTVLVSLAGQTLSLIGMTYIYVWLFNQTGSVVLSIVFHALTNVFNTVVMGEMPPSFAFVVAAMPWLAVFVLERVLGKEQFPGKPPEATLR